MSAKRVILTLSLAVLAVCGFLCAYGIAAGQSGTGTPASAIELAENTEETDYRTSPDAAQAEVEQTLRVTGTANPVAAILYQLRTFDTVFALLTLPVAVAVVLLLRPRARKGAGS